MKTNIPKNRRKSPSNFKRFAKEGRTTHAAFEAWRNLKFDPTKDAKEVEEFMINVKNLEATLEFNEEAQIMAIKCNMPRDVCGLCMQYNNWMN